MSIKVTTWYIDRKVKPTLHRFLIKLEILHTLKQVLTFAHLAPHRAPEGTLNILKRYHSTYGVVEVG